MADLRDFLRYLKREDVNAVVLQTGAAVAVDVGGQARHLTKQPLTSAHINGLIGQTPVAQLVPRQDTNGSPTEVELFGRAFTVTIARRGDRLRVRFEGGWRGEMPSIVDGSVEQMEIERSLVPGGSGGAVQAGAMEMEIERNGAPGSGGGMEIERNVAMVAQQQPAPRQPAPQAEPVSQRRPQSGSPRVAGGTAQAPRGLLDLLRKARHQNASDVHITSDRPCQVRACGQLRPIGQNIADKQVRAMLDGVLTKEHQAQLEERGYADFALQLGEGAGRQRVNVNRHRYGVKGCFRLVASEPPPLESLGLPAELMKITTQHQGLVVVAGPNGQGKTTTMAALVDWFNTNRPYHIITVEDPVEIVHPVKQAIVSQREVGTHTKSPFAALKGSLREDPDVIAIGELRDRETVEMALSAAETGHLVMATMSTPSGAKTIDRLIDMFPPDDQSQVRATMAGALKFVVSQRLVPTVDGSSMVAAAELISGNIPLWKLIRDNKLFQLPSLMQRGRNFGMVRIEDSLMELMKLGKITRETAEHYSDDPRALDGAARAGQPQAPAVASNGGLLPQPPQAPGKIGGLKNLFGRRGS